jgi:hypothetical protein
MKCRRLLLTLIPLALLAACGSDNDDSKSATNNSTTGSGVSPTGTGPAIAGGGSGTGQSPTGTGGSNSGNGSNGANNSGGTGGSGGSGGTGGTGGSGGSGGSGDDGSGAPGDTTVSGDPASGGGSDDPGAPAAPGPTTPPVDEGFGTVAIDVNAQTVFGFGVGPAKVSDVLDKVSADLGKVTNDTDWYTLPRTSAGGIGDCLADQESRILRWGDLSIAFWRKDGAESIWSWSVGDPSVSGYGDRREPNIPAAPERTGLRTAEGISVGSSFDDVADAYDQKFQFVPETPEDTSGIHMATATAKTAAGAAISMLEVGGPIVGIGSTLPFC